MIIPDREQDRDLEDQEAILEVSCKKPKDFGKPGDMWTLRRLCEYLNGKNKYPKRLSISYISKLHKKRHIVPHRVRYYLTSKDSLAKERTDRIHSIYKALRNGELINKEVVLVDEKTCIQALKNIRRNILPHKDGPSCCLRDQEYKRLGVTHLISGHNLGNGTIYGTSVSRNRSEEFFEFLEHLNSQIDQSETIVLVLDNYKTHNSKKLKKLLQEHGLIDRFESEFIPTHSSWMNPIEGVFSKLQRGYLKHLRVDSLERLKDTIHRSIEEIDLSKRPPNWDRFIQSCFNK